MTYIITQINLNQTFEKYKIFRGQHTWRFKFPQKILYTIKFQQQKLMQYRFLRVKNNRRNAVGLEKNIHNSR